MRTSEPGSRNRIAATDTILNHVVEGLVGYRRDQSIGPVLAAAWTVTDGGATYTFRLRDDVTFQNGAPLTSKEVKWSFDRMLSPKSTFRCKSGYRGEGAYGVQLRRVEVVDRTHIRFRLAAPNSMFLHALADLQCIAAVLHPASVDAKGDWRAPIGTGPFELESWQKGVSTTLTRFKGYRPASAPLDGYVGNKSARVDRVRFLVIPEVATAKAALLSGQLDVLPSIPERLTDELRGDPRVRLSLSPTLGWVVLLVRSDSPRLHDVRRRRAIAHSIDFDAVARFASGGLASYNPSAVATASPYSSASFQEGYTYNPRYAKSLLRTSGYRGEPIIFLTERANTRGFDIAVMVQAMLREVGWNVHLAPVDGATRIDRYRSRDFDLMSFSFTPRADPALLFGSFVGSVSADKTAQWDTPLSARLLKSAQTASGNAERAAIFAQLHRQMIREVPIIGLFNGYAIDAVGSNVRGYRASPFGYPRLFGVAKSGV